MSKFKWQNANRNTFIVGIAKLFKKWGQSTAYDYIIMFIKLKLTEIYTNTFRKIKVFAG